MKNILLIALVALSVVSCKESRCSNGEQNKKEDGIDCGGDCEPCATCTDGIKNQAEVEVDCGGECGVCYPANGHYGINILDESTTQFYLAPEYSLHAKLPDGASLKIIFTNTSPNINSELWFYNLGSGINLVISTYNETTGVQTFESVDGAEEIDLNMSFGGSGSATIDIYENEAATPTRTKNITW